MKSNSIEQTVEKASDRIPSAYCLSFEEMLELFDANNKDIVYALVIAYKYGFIKGTRAMKRKRCQML